MTKRWPLVPLGEVLTSASRPENVLPDVTYRILGAHWYAQGLYTKEIKPGSEIQATKVYRVEEGDFAYNRLFAWKGSFAIATKDNHGCYVSNEFPCFTVRPERADGQYLWRYFSRASAWEEALGLSTGGTPTSRNRLKEEKLLAMVIPLPPLPEQQRIVARIDSLVAKIEEARGLRHTIQDEQYRMLMAAFSSIATGAPKRPMCEVAPLVRRPIEVDAEIEYPELGIRSFGKGTFHKLPILGINVGSKKLFEIHPGDLVFNNVFAWEGAVAVAREEDIGRCGSHRFITCLPKSGVSTPRFLYFYFLTEQGLEQLRGASPGGAGRNRTLGLTTLDEIEVPVPSFEQQLWFDGLQTKVDALKTLQAEAATKLDALLPSILDRAFNGVL